MATILIYLFVATSFCIADFTSRVESFWGKFGAFIFGLIAGGILFPSVLYEVLTTQNDKSTK